MIKMNKYGYSLFMVIFSFFTASAQIPNDKPVNFFDVERNFDEWSKGKDLDKIKGWKWKKRWLSYNASRANANGTLARPSLIWEAYNKQKAIQKNSSAKLQSANWVSAGPDYLPPGADQYSSHGMGRINCIAFHPTDSNTFWVGVAQGGVWKTTNGGISWSCLTDNLPITRISDIAVDPINPDTMYISVGDFEYVGISLWTDGRKRNTHYGMGVFKTTDGGITWNPTGLSFNLNDFDESLIRRILIDPTNTNNLIAGGVNGIWKSANAGQNWTHINDSLIWDLEIDPSNSNIIYASTGYISNLNTGSAGIMKSTDFGNTWTVLNTGIFPNMVERIEITVSRKNPDYIYAVATDADAFNSGGFYGLYRSTDGGNNWSKQSDLFSAPNILGWDDGTTFGEGGQGTYDLAIITDANNSNKVFVGGVNVWGSADGGVNWDGVSYYYGTDYLHADQHFFAYNPLNEKYYVCNDGGLYVTDIIKIGSWNDFSQWGSWPTNWTNLSSGLVITSFYRLGLGSSLSSKNYIVAGAQDNSTFFYDGSSWTNIFGGDGMECLIDPFYPSQYVYGSYQYGGLLFSSDAGQSVGQAGLNISDVGEWTTPIVVDPNNPYEFYAAYGDVWTTGSGFQSSTWNPISYFTPLAQTGYPSPSSALAIAQSNSNYIYVAKRVMHQYSIPGEIWKTIDGGNNWLDITSGLPDSLYFTYIAVDDNDPNTLWVTCGGFYDGIKVFKSINGGLAWTNISYNLPNLPVNCIVHQKGSSDNTIYIGTDLGVYYINDYLSNWEPYSTNLPNVIVSELEIQYNDKKLYAATFGRGLWKSDILSGTTEARDGEMLNGNIQLFPSPNNGSFDLVVNNIESSELTMEVRDITGRIISSEVLYPVNGSINKHVNTRLSPGIYWVQLSTDDSGVGLKRFIVTE